MLSRVQSSISVNCEASLKVNAFTADVTTTIIKMAFDVMLANLNGQDWRRVNCASVKEKKNVEVYPPLISICIIYLQHMAL